MLSVCQGPPLPPSGGFFNISIVDGGMEPVFLAGDAFSYFCFDPLFGIPGEDETVCDSNGVWNPDTIQNCAQMCE